MAPRAPGGKVAEGPSEKLGLTLDCGLTVLYILYPLMGDLHMHVAARAQREPGPQDLGTWLGSSPRRPKGPKEPSRPAGN